MGRDRFRAWAGAHKTRRKYFPVGSAPPSMAEQGLANTYPTPATQYRYSIFFKALNANRHKQRRHESKTTLPIRHKKRGAVSASFSI